MTGFHLAVYLLTASGSVASSGLETKRAGPMGSMSADCLAMGFRRAFSRAWMRSMAPEKGATMGIELAQRWLVIPMSRPSSLGMS